MDLTKEEMYRVDLLVAKLVMGYPFYDDEEIATALKNNTVSLNTDSKNPQEKTLLTDADARALQRPPPFCREKGLALSVVDRLAEDGLTILMSRNKTDWAVKIMDDADRILGQASYTHLGTTICIAALRALGVKV